MTNILIVDDEKEIADLIEIYLVSDGYKVFKAYEAEGAMEILKNEDISLLLLDVMLPGMSGLELCKEIRKESNIPIIMISAKDEDIDKIIGLGTGADDYITKPFNPLEVSARVKSQLRRYTKLNPNAGGNENADEIEVDRLKINKKMHKVFIDDQEIKLTPIEFDILFLLASNVDRVYSCDEIFELIWNEKSYEANNTVMVHIRRLRGKIKAVDKNLDFIKTVWGVGYKFEV